MDVEESFTPDTTMAEVAPLQFLIVSSSSERRVVFTLLKNLKSRTGQTFTLIGSGLTDPRGIALDRDRGALYVADIGAQKIFRYRIYVQNRTTLVTDRTQLTIVEGAMAEWVAVDEHGDLYYTDQSTKTINRVPLRTVTAVSQGVRTADSLVFLSQTTLEGQAKSSTQDGDDGQELTKVYQLYDGSVNPHVEAPAGIASDGHNVYWSNAIGGRAAGSVVRGKVHPRLVGGVPHFESEVLENSSDTVFSLTRSQTAVFYTTNSSGEGAVYGVSLTGAEAHRYLDSLVEPRGLAWDGENTVYVADTVQNAVWSFPCGLINENNPRKMMSAAVNGPYGVALLSEGDLAFKLNAGPRRAGARRAGLAGPAFAGLAASLLFGL